nr:hypothetical protein Iba_chr14aCG21070 [Ipomoea batatas]GMD91205.1 hypothetical protein Iba_chr14dCG17130 [Ipomoea batatas]GME04810.1 hypothetical protein Iba_scaffold2300CG2220 [Ipomoea batatas]
MSYKIEHEHPPFIGVSSCSLSLFLSTMGGRTTTCIVMTAPATSATGSLDSESVLLFSSIFPALISFTSLIVLGPFSLSAKLTVLNFSLRDPTVLLGLYLFGPISLPSASLNLISTNSATAIETPLQILIIHYTNQSPQ